MLQKSIPNQTIFVSATELEGGSYRDSEAQVQSTLVAEQTAASVIEQFNACFENSIKVHESQNRAILILQEQLVASQKEIVRLCAKLKQLEERIDTLEEAR